MILFKPEHVPMILSGEKKETRRVWKRKRCNVGSIHKAKLKLFSKEFFAQLDIKYVYVERLGEITEEGARLEGYPSRQAFLDKFMEINGDTPLYREIWVIGFDLFKGDDKN